jgi:tryptophan synthase alpha chain
VRLEAAFRDRGRPLLMPYATGGYPDLDGCRRIVSTYVEAGADIVELGIPFSDPLADGPVIQASSQAALAQGVRPRDVFALAGDMTREGANLVFLSYLNTVLAHGPERFFAACAEEGVLGVVVPDLPVEEADEVRTAAAGSGVDLVFLAAPTSPDERLERIAQAASGFIYCVSVVGVTGVRDQLGEDLPEFLGRLRRRTSLPLAVGFGVSTPEQAGVVAALADGVIIGSRLVRLVQEAPDLDAGLKEIDAYLRAVREAMKSAPR